MMMMDVAAIDGASDGMMTPKKTSMVRFVTVFGFVAAVYAAATILGPRTRGDPSSVGVHHDITMRDLLQTETSRSTLRREAQSKSTPQDGTRLLQNRTRMLQNRTRMLQNRTRMLQNGTRMLQAQNGTRMLQNRTRMLQNRTRHLQEEELDNYDHEVSMEFLFPETMDLQLPSPCHRVDVGMPNSPEWRARCQRYLNEEYALKDCEGETEKVPRIYHSVSHYSDQTYHQLATAAQNPSFVRNHLSDEEAADFIKNHCGEEAYEAYRCFAPPAYRADLFRFCALYSQGGIYLDEDIFPFVPLEDLYSPCATATVGHDFPWMDKKGKQMKILASAPGAPIFQCALHTIIENVRVRAYPESELELTGPQMLEKCFEQHEDDVAVTYHDTRNAEWPFTGMRRGQKILAYEIPMSSKHFWQEGGQDKEDYKDLFNKRMVYKETCELQ